MKAIVAVDLNWGIGFKGNLLQRIPDDMKYFKQKTMGKIVIMGRGTFDSLPGKKPLKDRINIVLSKSDSFKEENVTVCHSLGELFNEIEQYDQNDVFVIGGESIYTQLLPCCTEAYVTKIQSAHEADKFFINIDKEESWHLYSTSELRKYNDFQFSFNKYINKCHIK